MLGKTISHYRIIEKLGQGGMGEVYLAEDTRLGHKVAIKKLSERMVADRSQRARFEREARAVAHLSHPNILTLHEYDEIDSDLFFIMEYASGGSLNDVLEQSPDGVDLERVVRWGIQAAEGLAEAHRNGVLHRDIKPANLLLTETGDLRIADFGLARAVTDTQITQTGAVLGTLAFMAPEQMAGREADSRADIFSLGGTLCELLAGSREDRASGAYAISQLSADSLRKNRPELPVELSLLVDEMLEKDPALRIGSAQEVASRLRAIQGRQSSDDTVHIRPSAAKSRRRLRWQLPLVAVLAAILVILGVRYFGGGIDPPRTVAVLPLRDISPDGTQAALAAGLTEAIITDLGRIGSISVISRLSAEKFAASDLSIPEIGSRLGADAILDASVLRVGDRVQLRAALVDSKSDRNLWTIDFERELTDVIALQHDISAAVADGIRAQLTPGESAAYQTSRQVDPAAFDRYITARSLWASRQGEALVESVSIYRELVEAHPDFAEAWAGLADAQIVSPSYADFVPKDTMAEARRSATRAIEIDPELASAWNILAEIAWSHDFDYAESERLRKRSLQLNPSSATTHQWYAEFLTAMGRHVEALDQVRIAQRLDPLSPLMRTIESSILVYARRFDEATQLVEQLALAYADSPVVMGHITWVLRRIGEQPDRAFALDIERRRRSELSEVQVTELEAAYAEAGWTGVENWNVRNALRRLAAGEHVKARWIALSYAWLGDKDNCMQWIEASYRERGISLLRLKVDVWFDGMRDDPRFQEMMRRINLAPGRS